MKIIKSKDNNIYKAAVKLSKKKYRDEQGAYLIEGPKPIKDAINLGADIQNIFIKAGANAPEIKEIKAKADPIIIELDDKLFDKLTDTENSQGVVAQVGKQQMDFTAFVKAVKPGENVIVLDGLQDPGNIGTIIRTAEAGGYSGIIATTGTGDIFAPKTVRAAAGSILRMPVIQGVSVEQAVNALKSMDKKITVTSLEAERNCFEEDLSEDIALVIGNEGRGVSQDFLSQADVKVIIPMAGSIESLNAAVAAGILIYQSYNKK